MPAEGFGKFIKHAELKRQQSMTMEQMNGHEIIIIAEPEPVLEKEEVKQIVEEPVPKV